MERKKLINFNNREIAISGVLLSFILFFMLVPLNFMPIDTAFLPLIAVIVACQVVNTKTGVFMATVFGLASLLAAFIRPTALSPIFYNPLVSVLPRIFIGITVSLSFKGMLNLTSGFYKRKKAGDVNLKKVKNSALLFSSAVSAAVGVLTNTSLVVSLIYIFNAGKSFGGIYIDKTFVGALLGINFIIEFCICTLLTPAIVAALHAVLKKDPFIDAKNADLPSDPQF